MPAIDAHLRSVDVRQVCVSAVTRGEVRFGARRLSNAKRLQAEVEKFLNRVRTLAWDEDAADRFAEVKAGLERSGTPIGVMDTMIAAHALSVGATLVTNNTRHFERVKGLNLENWAE